MAKKLSELVLPQGLKLVYTRNPDGTVTPKRWLDAKTNRPYAGRRKEGNNWYIYGSDGTRTLVGNNKYNISYTTKNGNNKKINRVRSAANLSQMNDYFANILNPFQRAALIGSAIQESGGDVYAKTPLYVGLLQYVPNRYTIKHNNNSQKELKSQLDYINSTVNGSSKDWTRGVRSSGYSSGKDAYNSFKNATSIEDAVRALTYGYIRPGKVKKETMERGEIAQHIYPQIMNASDSIAMGLLPPIYISTD